MYPLSWTTQYHTYPTAFPRNIRMTHSTMFTTVCMSDDGPVVVTCNALLTYLIDAVRALSLVWVDAEVHAIRASSSDRRVRE